MPGHSRLKDGTASKAWMAGSSPAMTENELPAQRQLDRSMRTSKTRF
jgi:hypothetical protein